MRKFSLRTGPHSCVNRKAACAEAALGARPAPASSRSRRILAVLAVSSLAFGEAASEERVPAKVVRMQACADGGYELGVQFCFKDR